MNRNVILAHRDLEAREIEAAQCYFDVERLRTKCCYDRIVIPRGYGAIDWKELEEDLHNLGSRPINSYRQRQYIENFDYYNDVGKYTFDTYFSLSNIMMGDYHGPFVVKGVTNSKKQNWNTSMYAETKDDLWRVVYDLNNDGFIGYQKLIFRKYVPLKNLGYLLNGLPISEEYRLFFYKGNLLVAGFYWSTAPEDIVEKYKTVPHGAIQFSLKFSDIIGKRINFWVADIAKTARGDWILVELNDGCSAGISECDPNTLYRNLQFRIFDEPNSQ